MADSSQLPTIVPMLSYEDVAGAIDWLTRAFGFRETENERYTEPDGKVSHAEMRLGGGAIMLGSPSPHYEGPRRHAESCEAARRWREPGYVVDGVHVLVDDVDAHFRRAKEAGATILSEPEDQPYQERVYRVEDLDGHRWMFGQPIQ
jgi:PhnB protein